MILYEMCLKRSIVCCSLHHLDLLHVLLTYQEIKLTLTCVVLLLNSLKLRVTANKFDPHFLLQRSWEKVTAPIWNISVIGNISSDVNSCFFLAPGESCDLALLLRAWTHLSRGDEIYICIFRLWRRQQTSTMLLLLFFCFFFIPTLYSEAKFNTPVRIINSR